MKGRNQLLLLLGLYILLLNDLPLIVTGGTWLALWLSTGGVRWLYLAVNTLPRDLRYSQHHPNPKQIILWRM